MNIFLLPAAYRNVLLDAGFLPQFQWMILAVLSSVAVELMVLYLIACGRMHRAEKTVKEQQEKASTQQMRLLLSIGQVAEKADAFSRLTSLEKLDLDEIIRSNLQRIMADIRENL